MAKKKSSDLNVTALEILRAVTGESVKTPRNGKPIKKPTKPVKNPAAVALGRLGGLKGGKARAQKLSGEARREIARKAARARWQTKTKEAGF
ncbi:MAG TPA: hypothetical protein VIW47_00265 [Nitrospiraceae bacterium]|jgi:hypothetical protein